jgi:hypothetical protein
MRVTSAVDRLYVYCADFTACRNGILGATTAGQMNTKERTEISTGKFYHFAVYTVCMHGHHEDLPGMCRKDLRQWRAVLHTCSASGLLHCSSIEEKSRLALGGGLGSAHLPGRCCTRSHPQLTRTHHTQLWVE